MWHYGTVTWFQHFVIYWSQLQELFLDILNMWPLHLPDMSGTMSDEQIQHYLAAKTKNCKRFSVSIHMVPWNLLKYHVLNVITPQNQPVNLTNAKGNLCPQGVVARPM